MTHAATIVLGTLQVRSDTPRHFVGATEGDVRRSLVEYIRASDWGEARICDSHLPPIAQTNLEDDDIIDTFLNTLQAIATFVVIELPVAGISAIVPQPPEPRGEVFGYRHVVVLEFLGETPMIGMDVRSLLDASLEAGGELSMNELAELESPLDGPTTADLLVSHGSATEFFRLDADGKPVDDEFDDMVQR